VYCVKCIFRIACPEFVTFSYIYASHLEVSCVISLTSALMSPDTNKEDISHISTMTGSALRDFTRGPVVLVRACISCVSIVSVIVMAMMIFCPW
jgi:hypothetical protein